MPAHVWTTSCPMDCPDTCALQVSVENGRATSIRGVADSSLTRGFICDKVAQFTRRVEHAERLRYPLRRRGPKGSGEFARITWTDAIAEIATRYRQICERWGGEAIWPYHYGGSNGFLNDGFLDDLFFARLGASRCGRTLCAVPATMVATGMYGKMPGVAFEDYPAAKFILIWGANPKASNIHLVPFLKEAKRRGATIAAVDPIRNFTDVEVDWHLPIYPGSDVAVALAMIRIWNHTGLLASDFLAQNADGLEALLAAAEAWSLERAAAAARVTASDIQRIATLYAESSPAALRVGWGLERNINGAQAMAAILAMPALLGKFGVRGGGYTLSNSGGAKLDTKQIFGDVPWATRELNMSQLGELLLNGGTPPVKGLFVYNCNPVATAPDQNAIIRGLQRGDLFTVVHEQVMTDSALYADIVLPATTFLEHYDVRRGYGNYVVGGVRPVIPAAGEAKPNEEVFALLGRAMGFRDEAFKWDSPTCVRRLAGALKIAGKPANVDAILAGRQQRYDFPGALPVQFKTVFPQTPDKKIHLTPGELGPRPFFFKEIRDAAHPLALLTPATSRMISSTFGEWNYPELRVELHPDDAAARDIREGDAVRVFNLLGEVHCKARINSRLRPGVAAMPKGAWQRSSKNGQTGTALCPAHVQVTGGAACYNDARVEIARLASQ